MTAPIRIKRRVSGLPGAPSELLNAEIAYNEVDDVFYYGKGTGGAGGTATSVMAIGGPGAFVALSGTQSIGGQKTFTGSVHVPAPTQNTHAVTKKYVDDNLAMAGVGDMLKSVYDTDNDGKVDSAQTADVALEVAWGNITSKPTTFTPSAHSHPISDVTNLQSSLDAKAPLASPGFSGTPTAPTPSNGDSSTKIATTAFVTTVVTNLIGAAPGALDTLAEIAAALGDDPNFAATVTTGLSEKMVKTANLSDVSNVATARSNLGLGSMALQNASAVAITGGTIDNVTIDGGTF